MTTKALCTNTLQIGGQWDRSWFESRTSVQLLFHSKMVELVLRPHLHLEFTAVVLTRSLVPWNPSKVECSQSKKRTNTRRPDARPFISFPLSGKWALASGPSLIQMCEERNTRVELGTCLCWCWWPFVAVFNQEVVFVSLLVSRQQFSLERGGTSGFYLFILFS